LLHSIVALAAQVLVSILELVNEKLAFGLAAWAGEANSALATKKSVGRTRRGHFMRDTSSRSVRAVPTEWIELAMSSPPR
jgi:hypothetical protein